MNGKYLFIILLSYTPLFILAQGGYIKTKEGGNILDRRQLINDCLQSLHKDRSDKTALEICTCQADKLDKHFTKKEYSQFTKARIIDLNGLLKSDSLFEKQMQQCYTNSGKTALLQAEGFEEEFINRCKASIQENTERTLDENKLNKFCTCQLNMVKTKKLTDAELATLSNPNSVLFYETMYTCGDPFAEKENGGSNWNTAFAKDIDGPASDTIMVLNLNGMTYLKIKTGSMVQFWLMDTGASDLLINKEMESTLKEQAILKNENYLGTGEYEMANGVIDTCRKYTINNVQIGKYTLSSIVVAVTDKGKRIIAGKSLLNKFSNWFLDNKTSTLVLTK